VPEYLAPGVYVEETSFRARSIEGVGTSTTAFAGPTRKGPVASAELLPEILTSYADFERIYGGYADLSLAVANAADARPINHLAHAVRAYFNEGGSRLYVARVYAANGGAAGTASSADLRVGAAPPAEDDTNRIRFVARFPGRSGNGAVPTNEQPNLRGIQTREIVAPAPQRVLDSAPVGSIVRTGAGPFNPLLKREGGWFAMADNGSIAADAVAANAAALANASLITLAVIATDADGGSLAIDDLGLDRTHPRFVGTVMSPTPNRRADQIENLYALRIGSAVNARQLLDALFPDGQNPAATRANGRRGSFSLSGGDDGAMPTDAAYVPALAALAKIDDIAIVAAPGSSAFTSRDAIRNALITHAEGRRMYRIAVLDTDAGLNAGDARNARSTIDSKYAALYYPWVVISNPNARPGRDDIPREIALPPSGFLCGIYARNDIERGVHKAPANEVVRGALRFEREISFGEQEMLNPLGVNCLRFFPGRGYRVWGARTASSDPEWKYVNIRRYFNYLEASIDRSTQWAVFEPNGERLWANIRETIASFLYNEWRNGALLGSKAEDAYFVRCDRSTMTQNDLDNGRLVCLIGVAALKPAEFVIFRIGQKTADARD
jgi:phage tail sheath protein FI